MLRQQFVKKFGPKPFADHATVGSLLPENAPRVAGGGVLPAPADGGAPLPTPATGGAPLPAPTAGGAPLPTPSAGGAPLPTPAVGGAPLPVPTAGGAPMPTGVASIIPRPQQLTGTIQPQPMPSSTTLNPVQQLTGTIQPQGMPDSTTLAARNAATAAASFSDVMRRYLVAMYGPNSGYQAPNVSGGMPMNTIPGSPIFGPHNTAPQGLFSNIGGTY